MDVRVAWSFNLNLSKEEWRLVSKALRGVLKPGDETEDALDLQKRMLRSKHEILRQALGESQKAIDNIDSEECKDLKNALGEDDK
jgi:hypothetical protein